MNCNRTLLYILIFSFQVPIPTLAHAADENLVNFRVVCKVSSPDCIEARIEDTKEEILVQKHPTLTLEDIASASVSSQTVEFRKHAGSIIKRKENPALLLTFRDSQKLHDITAKNIGQRLAIFINDTLIMAPKIMMPIAGDTFKVSGANITQQKAKSLAEEINKAVTLKKSQ